MMRMLACLLACLCSSPLAAESSFDRAAMTGRATALGGAAVALADDPSTIFYNPAGMTVAGRHLYGDYAQPRCRGCRDEVRAAAAIPLGGVTVGAGWYLLDREGGAADRLFILGASRQIVEGTQGSFFAVGGALRLGRISVEGAGGGGPSSDDGVTGDAGVVLRPLPVVSLGYSVENAVEPEIEAGDRSGGWRRIQHWGAALFWDNRVTVSFESRHSAGRSTLHYGVAVRAEVPVELMAGFSEGSAYGGARWVGRGPHGAVSFAAEDNDRPSWSVSLEIPLGGGQGE